ncbi:TPA: hypothetical protein NIA45_006750 [Pseudomonas aeruginosa]|nr:hypothetical protein [Pseudomonas aeruginosa]
MLMQFRKKIAALRESISATARILQQLAINPIREHYPFQRKLAALRLAAMRQAMEGRLPDVVNVSKIVADDFAEPELRPRTTAETTQRLFNSRLAMHAATHIETSILARQFGIAVAAFLLVMVLTFVMPELGMSKTVMTYAVNFSAIALIGIGLYFVYLALGVSRNSYELLLPESTLNDAELADAEAHARNVLIREIPEGTPEDLRSAFRLKTFDSQGRPVDTQILPEDFDGAYAVEAMSLAHNTWLLLGLGLITTSATSFFGLLVTSIVGGSLLAVAVGWAGMKAFALPKIASRRASAVHLAMQSSAAAALVANSGTVVTRKIEESRKFQLHRAANDKTAFIKLGTSTGFGAERGDHWAPTQAGLPVGLTALDAAPSLYMVGESGCGKSYTLGKIAEQWVNADAGGLIAMCGTGVYPRELAKRVPSMRLISPKNTPLAIIQGMPPEEISAAFYDQNTTATKDPKSQIWNGSAEIHIRNALKVLKIAGRLGDGFAWTLSSAYDLIFDSQINQRAKALVMGSSATMAKLPRDFQRAVEYFFVKFPNEADGQRDGVLMTVRSWLEPIVGHKALRGWAECESGISLEDAFKGAIIGFDLPEIEYGPGGALVTALAKRRFYRAVQLRGTDWLARGEKRVLLIIDEVQLVFDRSESDMLGVQRKHGLISILATQSLDALKQRVPAELDLEKNFANFVSLMAFRVTTEYTKKLVSSRFGTSARPFVSGLSAQYADTQAALTAMQNESNGYSSGTTIGAAVRSPQARGARVKGMIGQSAAMLGNAIDKLGITKAISGLGEKIFGQSGHSISLARRPFIEPNEIEDLLHRDFMALVCIKRGGAWVRELIDPEAPPGYFPEIKQEAA